MDSQDQDMYDDSPPSGGAATAQKPDPSEKSDSPTAVISKEAFGGRAIKPGSECTFRILRVNENDVEVQYSSEDESEDEMGQMME